MHHATNQKHAEKLPDTLYSAPQQCRGPPAKQQKENQPRHSPKLGIPFSKGLGEPIPMRRAATTRNLRPSIIPQRQSKLL